MFLTYEMFSVIREHKNEHNKSLLLKLNTLRRSYIIVTRNFDFN